MLLLRFILALSAVIFVSLVLAVPVSHTSPLTDTIPSGSGKRASSSGSKAVTSAQREAQYKPRGSFLLLTGSARQQVEQFRYSLPPKRPNESEEAFQARKDKKVQALEARKKMHLRKIEALKQEYGDDDEGVVTKHYNEWVQNKKEKYEFQRVKRMFKLENLTKEDFEKMRQGGQQEGGSMCSQHSQRIMIERKFNIKRTMKKGDEHSMRVAKERMKKYGITDLTDGRRLGARKRLIRTALLKDPSNEMAIQEALKLGMDPSAPPTSRRSKKRPSTTLTNDELMSSSGTIIAQDQASSSRLLPKHLPSPTTNEKSPLPFDLNLDPPIDD